MPRTMPPPPVDRFWTPVFYYGAVSVVWCWYEVDLDVLEGYLNGLGMKPGRFTGGKGLVNFSFMSAASLFGSGSVADPSHGQPANNPGGSVFNETELNVVAYPKARENDVPDDLSAKEFIFGADQSKNLGVYRLHVACDNPAAIAAGRAYYYENKFLAFYNYTSPSLNRTLDAQIASADKWSITCLSADAPDAPQVYRAEIDLSDLTLHGANASEVIDISYDAKESRVLGSRRNFLGVHQVALLDDGTAGRVEVTVGPGGPDITPDCQQMLDDMNRLVANRDAIAVQRFESPACIAEAVPYYMDQI